MKGKTIVVAGGLAESLINFRGPLLRALQTKGLRVVACAPDDGVTPAKLAELGVEFLPVRLTRASMNPLRDLVACWDFYRVFRRVKPDMALFYTIKPVIYGSLAAWLARVPRRVSMITGLGYAFTEGAGRSRVLQAVQALYRLALFRNQRVIFQNPDDMGLFIERGLVRHADQCVRVHGSGVDLTHYQPAPLPKAPIFLLVGRLLADKGVREYAEAARIIRQRHPEALFRLVGWIDSNPSAIRPEELKAWVDDGTLQYLGRLLDVRPAIEDCAVYVLPSYREGTPRSVLEAMAMGRAVVTTDAPGCRETVVEGENGYLVPVKDAAALAAAMQRFIDEPDRIIAMGEKSLKMAHELYDVNKVNAAILEVLDA